MLFDQLENLTPAPLHRLVRSSVMVLPMVGGLILLNLTLHTALPTLLGLITYFIFATVNTKFALRKRSLALATALADQIQPYPAPEAADPRPLPRPQAAPLSPPQGTCAQTPWSNMGLISPAQELRLEAHRRHLRGLQERK